MVEWPAELGEVLLKEVEILERVAGLGQQNTADYRGMEPLVVGVLRGAAIFHADLIRRLDMPVKVDFLSVSSYGSQQRTSGEVRLVKDLESSIEGIHVILVEDIVDTGLTLNYLLRNLLNRTPASLSVCSLLSKPERRQTDVAIDYLGFEIPNKFVVGYGLDYDQKLRNLPYVAELNGFC